MLKRFNSTHLIEMLKGKASGVALGGVRGNTRKLLDMDEKCRVTNGRQRGSYSVRMWEI